MSPPGNEQNSSELDPFQHRQPQQKQQYYGQNPQEEEEKDGGGGGGGEGRGGEVEVQSNQWVDPGYVERQ